MITYHTTLTGTNVLDVFNGNSPTGIWEVQISSSQSVALSIDGTTAGALLETVTGSSSTTMSPYVYIVKDQPLYLIGQGVASAIDIVITPVIPISICVGTC